jgi:hypothetical protein
MTFFMLLSFDQRTLTSNPCPGEFVLGNATDTTLGNMVIRLCLREYDMLVLARICTHELQLGV